MGATVHGPGEGEALGVGPSRALVKVGAEHTGGALTVTETTIGPGFPGPPPHVHERMHDMFYVLEGALTVHLGEETTQALPGTFVCVPPGVAHTFSNPSDAPVRMLNLNAPGGFEGYLRELSALFAGGAPTPEAFGEVLSRYDTRIVAAE